jgi:septum formation protein
MALKHRLILASASPRRQRLMEQLGLEFSIVPSGAKEEIEPTVSPTELVMRNAYLKAQDVAERIGEGLIIGADTLVVLKDKIMGKPRSASVAVEMLRLLSGRTHQVYTGIAVVDASRNYWLKDYMCSSVTMKNLNPEQIKDYVESGEPLGKAGAYAIQGRGEILISKINGCYSNIVGLPLPLLNELLLGFGISVIKGEGTRQA